MKSAHSRDKSCRQSGGERPPLWAAFLHITQVMWWWSSSLYASQLLSSLTSGHRPVSEVKLGHLSPLHSVSSCLPELRHGLQPVQFLPKHQLDLPHMKKKYWTLLFFTLTLPSSQTLDVTIHGNEPQTSFPDAPGFSPISHCLLFPYTTTTTLLGAWLIPWTTPHPITTGSASLWLCRTCLTKLHSRATIHVLFSKVGAKELPGWWWGNGGFTQVCGLIFLKFITAHFFRSSLALNKRSFPLPLLSVFNLNLHSFLELYTTFNLLPSKQLFLQFLHKNRIY